MKTLRVWLLVLLAVLLPIRGAVAAAMLCPLSGAGGQSEQQSHDRPTGHALGDTAHHAPMQHEHGAVDGHHADSQSSGPSDKCNLCCDFCSVTPLASSLPTVPVPQDLSAISFPAISAPAPSFVSDGQERPPRSS